MGFLVHATRRRTAGLMLVLAALTGLVLPCLCAGMMPVEAEAGHACCVPPAGVRAASTSCCADGHDDGTSPVWTSVAALSLPVPATPLVLRAVPVAPLAVAAPPQRPVAASPPLRI